MAREASTLRLLYGDESDLFQTYNNRLRTAVRRQVNATDTIIEDACSYAWEELLRRQPQRDQIFCWLRRVAIREAWRQRDRADRDLLSDSPEDHHPGVADKTFVVTYANELIDMIRTLPPRQQRVLLLLVSGHSYKEIAAEHDLSWTSVNKALTRARRHLRLVHDAD